jgi:hypothetical protein
MAQVFRCDLCGEIDGHNIYGDRDYCGKCNSIIYEMETEAYKKVMKELVTRYDQTTRNLAQVIQLAKWFQIEQPEAFMTAFGTQGTDLLKQALEK